MNREKGLVLILVAAVIGAIGLMVLAFGLGKRNKVTIVVTPTPVTQQMRSVVVVTATPVVLQGAEVLDETDLVDLGGLADFAKKNESFISWFDWDEENPHAWSRTHGLYAPDSIYADTSINGSAVYDLDVDFLGLPEEAYDGRFYVVVTGVMVNENGAFLGAFPLNHGMRFYVANGAIMIVEERYAQGEACARLQQAVTDYGLGSIRLVDVPDNWQCQEHELAAGLIKDPTRHVDP